MGECLLSKVLVVIINWQINPLILLQHLYKVTLKLV